MFSIEAWLPRVYELNEKWWRDIKTNLPKERDEGELFCLMASELSEAMEGDRKKLPDDKVPHFPMVGVEMVDFVIRIMDYCSRRDIPLRDVLPELLEEGQADELATMNRAGIIWSFNCRLVKAFFDAPEKKSYRFSRLIADARLFCRVFIPEHSFEEMFEAKFNYNVGRADHKHEARAAVNGKEY